MNNNKKEILDFGPDKKPLQIMGFALNPTELLSKKRNIKIISVSFFLFIIIFISANYFFSSPNYEFNTYTIKREDLIVNIMATGNISPLNEVDVGAEISGLIESVHVDFNDKIKKGMHLAVLNKDQLQARVRQSRAQLNSSKAKVQEAEANKTEAYNNLQRAISLFNKENYSEQSLEKAKTSFSRTEAALTVALSQVTISEANLFADETNLSKAVIKAPIDGIVLERKVEPGQTVAASFQTPILFKLAEDLTVMELTVDIDEADIGQIKVGQKASFSVDAYPGRIFPSLLNLKMSLVHYLKQFRRYSLFTRAGGPISSL